MEVRLQFRKTSKKACPVLEKDYLNGWNQDKLVRIMGREKYREIKVFHTWRKGLAEHHSDAIGPDSSSTSIAAAAKAAVLWGIVKGIYWAWRFPVEKHNLYWSVAWQKLLLLQTACYQRAAHAQYFTAVNLRLGHMEMSKMTKTASLMIKVNCSRKHSFIKKKTRNLALLHMI